MEKYKKLNTYTGWFIFLIATIVYFMTVEDTVSLWDCGEYITAAYKLEVGHPPGAPLFMILGRLFSFFAAPENVAIWINRMSALSSSVTILFMYWSITMLVKKMIFNQYKKRTFTTGEMIAVFGSAAVSALAYTFSDTFWFSAVEGEVYAMSSLFTAVIFWAILKWDEEMDAIKFNEIESNQNSLKWLLLIMFLFGLAIGVHLLGLLVIPSITYVIYFNQAEKVDFKKFFFVGILSVVILGGIQEGIIPGIIALASKMEIFFVNSLGMPFYSGAIFFVILFVVIAILAVRYANKNNKSVLHAVVLGGLLLIIGYGSFATIVIRSNANTPLDENDPENLVTLHAYLKREQYGSWPILNGPYWNSQRNDASEYKDGNPKHVRRFVAMSGDEDVKAFANEVDAQKFVDSTKRGYEIVEKYYVHNKKFLKNSEVTYAQTTFLPRMWWTNPGDGKIEGYKKWSGYNPSDVESTDVMGADGARLPRFSENMKYFFHYQLDWMYWRYFMWNFAGRQNDIQGHGDEMRGNWLSGISFIDEMKLGAQGLDAPSFTADNEGYNRLFFLPLIFGLIGMIFHFYRAPKDAFVVLLTFIFTGLAIVVYLNQKPFEPRERDYAYAASFYMFAMWIGMAVYALFDIFRNFGKEDAKKAGIIVAAGIVIFGFAGLGSENGFFSLMSWLFIVGVSLALIALMFVLRKAKASEVSVAGLVTALALIVPVIMGFQNWDDHDRSGKTSALDLAHNYLESCGDNAIIFTNGDNDTFPLWYYQEVEGKRTDIRVCNLSLLGTDWYSEQMKNTVYKSEGLPIKFSTDQILSFDGATEQVFFHSLFELCFMDISEANFNAYFNLKYKHNKAKMDADYANTLASYKSKFASLRIKQNTPKVASVQNILNNADMENVNATNAYKMFSSFKLLIDCLRDGSVEDPAPNNGTLMSIQDLLKNFEAKANVVPLVEAMEFVRDDKHMLQHSVYGALRVIPASSFTMKVNKENVIKSGVVAEKDRANIVDQVTFTLTKQYVTKEQVMMLDILANNDWKRPIYFSSHYGSDVSIALFQEGFVKQVGIAFELVPLKNKYRSGMNDDRMYKNMMETYRYGKMNDGALTDYYTRRHTVQYRNNFTRLAEYYLNVAENNQQQINNYSMFISNNTMMPASQKDSLQKEIDKMKAEIPASKEKAFNLLKRSIEVMPVNMVQDYGEQPNETRPIQFGGLSINNYVDGTLHDLVTMMYRTGKTQEADKVAKDVFGLIKRNINYFMKSKPTFMYYNKRDFIAALNALFTIDMIANDPTSGNPSGAFAKEISNYIEDLAKKQYPAKLVEMNELADKANDNYADLYAAAYKDLKELLPALMSVYGYQVEGAFPQGGGQELTQEQIQQLIQQQQEQ